MQSEFPHTLINARIKGLIMQIHRTRIRGILKPEARSELNQETLTRAKYYLSQVLRSKQASPLPEAEELEAEAHQSMEELIALDPPRYENVKLHSVSVLYDYLVSDQLRLFTFRSKDELQADLPKSLSRQSLDDRRELGTRQVLASSRAHSHRRSISHMGFVSHADMGLCY
jgi:hypothetical protein